MNANALISPPYIPSNISHILAKKKKKKLIMVNQGVWHFSTSKDEFYIQGVNSCTPLEYGL